MLNYLLLGLIQGLTEFLPVSSSGHLFLAQEFFGLDQDLSLEVYLHAASLLAVILFFWDKIWELLREFLSALSAIGHQLSANISKKNCCHPEFIYSASSNNSKPSSAVSGSKSHLSTLTSHFTKNPKALLTLKLLVATLVTFPIALIVKDFVLVNLTMNTVAIALLVTGIMILVAEKFRSQKIQTFTWPTVILLGVIQGLAVIPGISRSGSTIALLILFGIQRRDSAEISFLLSIPTISGALLFIIFEQGFTHFSLEVLLSSITCFIASILAIKWMMKLIQNKWIYFVPYCLLLGLGLISLGQS